MDFFDGNFFNCANARQNKDGLFGPLFDGNYLSKNGLNKEDEQELQVDLLVLHTYGKGPCNDEMAGLLLRGNQWELQHALEHYFVMLPQIKMRSIEEFQRNMLKLYQLKMGPSIASMLMELGKWNMKAAASLYFRYEEKIKGVLQRFVGGINVDTVMLKELEIFIMKDEEKGRKRKKNNKKKKRRKYKKKKKKRKNKYLLSEGNNDGNLTAILPAELSSFQICISQEEILKLKLKYNPTSDDKKTLSKPTPVNGKAHTTPYPPSCTHTLPSKPTLASAKVVCTHTPPSAASIPPSKPTPVNVVASHIHTPPSPKPNQPPKLTPNNDVASPTFIQPSKSDTTHSSSNTPRSNTPISPTNDKPTSDPPSVQQIPSSNTSNVTKSVKLDADMRESSIHNNKSNEPTVHNQPSKSIPCPPSGTLAAPNLPSIISKSPSVKPSSTKAPYMYLKMPIVKHKYHQRIPWYREFADDDDEDDDEEDEESYNDVLNKIYPPSNESNPPLPYDDSTSAIPTPSSKQTLNNNNDSLNDNVVQSQLPSKPISKNKVVVNACQPPSNAPNQPSHATNQPSNNEVTSNASHPPLHTPNSLLNASNPPSNKSVPKSTLKNDVALNTSQLPSNDDVPSYTPSPPSKLASDNIVASLAVISPLKSTSDDSISSKLLQLTVDDEATSYAPLNSISNDDATSAVSLKPTPLAKPIPFNDKTSETPTPITKTIPSNDISATLTLPLNKLNPPSDTPIVSPIVSPKPTSNYDATSSALKLNPTSDYDETIAPNLSSKPTTHNDVASDAPNPPPKPPDYTKIPKNDVTSPTTMSSSSSKPSPSSNISNPPLNVLNPPVNVLNPPLNVLNSPLNVLNSPLNVMNPLLNNDIPLNVSPIHTQPLKQTTYDHIPSQFHVNDIKKSNIIIARVKLPPERIKKPPERSKKLDKDDIDPRDRDKNKYGHGSLDPRERDKNMMNVVRKYCSIEDEMDPRDRDKDGLRDVYGDGNDPRDRDKYSGYYINYLLMNMNEMIFRLPLNNWYLSAVGYYTLYVIAALTTKTLKLLYQDRDSVGCDSLENKFGIKNLYFVIILLLTAVGYYTLYVTAALTTKTLNLLYKINTNVDFGIIYIPAKQITSGRDGKNIGMDQRNLI